MSDKERLKMIGKVYIYGNTSNNEERNNSVF